MVVRATQTPFTRVLPAPHAAAISVIMLSGRTLIGAGVMACADTATDKANPAVTMSLIISHLPGADGIGTGSHLLLDAFSSREPVSTPVRSGGHASLENALEPAPGCFGRRMVRLQADG